MLASAKICIFYFFEVFGMVCVLLTEISNTEQVLDEEDIE